MNIAIIGCGYIGEKRARTLGEHELIVACDLDLNKALKIGKMVDYNIHVTNDWKQAIDIVKVELVIISTTNDCLVPIALYAVEKGKHILIEKPAARSAKELKGLMDVVERKNIKAKVGFNLRYHPALIKAKEIIGLKFMGELMFIRGRYGHGGRVGYEKEWRFNPEISGGGELIDQGVHLIDLARWFLGEFSKVEGSLHTYFWDIKEDDNSFLNLQTKDGKIAWLHASCTEWKNMFSLEIYGKMGKIQIDGLGGSYGIETLTYYQMTEKMGKPKQNSWIFDKDDSWQKEFDNFIRLIEDDQPVLNESLNDAYEALKIVDKLYENE